MTLTPMNELVEVQVEEEQWNQYLEKDGEVNDR